MTGVEILTSETIYNTILPEWCFVMGFVCMWVGIIVTFTLFAECYDIGPWITMAVSVVFMVIAILGGISNKNDISHIEYKVTIDDSVSMNEFLDKYEILDQEGKIYTVKEK